MAALDLLGMDPPPLSITDKDLGVLVRRFGHVGALLAYRRVATAWVLGVVYLVATLAPFVLPVWREMDRAPVEDEAVGEPVDAGPSTTGARAPPTPAGRMSSSKLGSRVSTRRQSQRGRRGGGLTVTVAGGRGERGRGLGPIHSVDVAHMDARREQSVELLDEFRAG